jgi:acid phosphatase family membrane protein YuiD
MSLSICLGAAIVAQFACQVFKVVYYSIRRNSFRPDYFVNTGGMPSSHSAMVSALTACVALTQGLSSPSFAVATVFSLIIIHDAVRVRGAVQLHAEILGRLVRHFPELAGHKVPARAGHSLAEVLVGVAVGLAFGLLAGLLFPAA